MTTAPTLYDVAREAGVSLATASRTLNGSTRKVNETYRERVLAAAERLGYTTNLSAQAVARGASATVALLVSDIADPYFSSIAAGVITGAEAHGLLVSMAVTGRDPARELALVRALRGQRPRVIVLAGSRFRDDAGRDALLAELAAYESAGGRVVLVGQKDFPYPTVELDDRGGATALADELVGLGYRGFAVLAGPPGLVTAGERLGAFEAALARHDIHPVRIEHGGFDRDGGFATAAELDLDLVDCVVAMNDVMAIGAMAALRERGIDLPGAVGVAGFDDIPTARDVHPPLTSVRLPLVQAGERAIASALDGDAAAPLLGSEVVVRASTPPR